MFQFCSYHDFCCLFCADAAERMYAHPEDKTKFEADITIDGETIHNVSISTKGNSNASFLFVHITVRDC